MLKRILLIAIPLAFLILIVLVLFGVIRAKQNREAALAEFALCEEQFNKGNYQEGAKLLEVFVKKREKSKQAPEANFYLAMSLEKLGEKSKTLPIWKKIIDKYSKTPNVAYAYYYVGADYQETNQIDKANEYYNIILDKYPDSPVIIGARFGVASGLVKGINNLTSDTLQIGQVLRIVKPDFNILVDVSKAKLYLKSGDEIVKRYTVAVGKKETPTPIGEFKVTDKLIKPTWFQTLPSGAKEIIPGGDPRNELGTRWIGFKPAYGIHGTIEPHLIGQPVSHGCVRMLNQDVEELYEIIGSGTPVKIVTSVN